MSDDARETGERIMLAIASIRTDFQTAECLNVETVNEYAEAFRTGNGVPPVTVQFDGQVYWLRDGFHRLAAARSIGLESIEAEVLQGTYADMEAEWQQSLKAALANLRTGHKARITNEGSDNE